MEFMKQVLPRFARPTAPLASGSPVTELRPQVCAGLREARGLRAAAAAADLVCVPASQTSSEPMSTQPVSVPSSTRTTTLREESSFDWLALPT